MRNINLYEITENPSDLKSALVKLRDDFDAHNHDGVSSKSFETVKFETLVGRTIAIKKLNYSDNTEGIWMGLANDTAKLFIGNSSNYIKWNGSAVSIKGAVTATSGEIGGFTIGSDYIKDTADSFGLSSKVTVGDDVRFWAGDTEANKATAPYQVTEAGKLITKSYSLISQYTAGENLVAGRLGCLKHTIASWGDDSEADRDTTAIHSTFVHVNSASPDTNYDEDVLAYCGLNNAGAQKIYGKIDLTSNPPGLPAWNEIEKVKLRIYVVFASDNTTTIKLRRLTASFDESTITYNNKPADDDIVWATPQTGTAILTETMATSADFQHTGYVEFDITELYRLWSASKLTNYGFVIEDIQGDTGSQFARIGSRTRVGGGDFNQAPYLVITIIKDEPGSGNPGLIANDGKIYHASDIEYDRAKNIIGIIGETKSVNETVDIYALADRSLIPQTVLSVDKNRNYYLNGAVGQITLITNDIPQSSKWSIPIGIGTANGLSIDLGKEMTFIKSITYPGTGVLPPPNARIAVIKWEYTTNLGDIQGGVNTLHNRVNTLIEKRNVMQASSKYRNITFTWGGGTSGLLTVSISVQDTTVSSKTINIYWYK